MEGRRTSKKGVYFQGDDTEHVVSRPKNEVHELNVLELRAKLDSALTREGLMSLKQELKSDGSITEESFIDKLNAILAGSEVTKDVLKEFFYKMDPKGTGIIKWERILNYLLIQDFNLTKMHAYIERPPFTPEPRFLSCFSPKDMVVKIEYHRLFERGPSNTVIDTKKGQYLIISRRGFLTYWTTDLRMFKKMSPDKVECERENVWVTSMVSMPNVALLALSTTHIDIRIFDCNPSKFERIYSFIGFEHCVVAMDYYTDFNNLSYSKLICADIFGSIFLIEFTECIHSSLFGHSYVRNPSRQINIHDFGTPAIPSAKLLVLKNIHTDYIKQIKYEVSLNSIISVAPTTKDSMVVHNLYSDNNVIFKIRGGFLCFIFSLKDNSIITGGMDYNICMWNPFVAFKPVFALAGHTAPVTQITLDSGRELIISASMNCLIKIWDKIRQVCIQTVNISEYGIGKSTVTAAYFSSKERHFIVGTYQIGIMESTENEQSDFVISHLNPIAGALYNSLFNYVVSACEGSTIVVWDFDSGKKLMQIFHAHYRILNSQLVNIPINALAVDLSGRRVFSGGRDGKVKTWNVNNGECTNEWDTVGHSDITKIVVSPAMIIVSGWNRRLTVFFDSAQETSSRVWQARHRDDILGVDFYRDKFVASAAYDGEVIIWAGETGYVRYVLRDPEPPGLQGYKNASIQEKVNIFLQKRPERTDTGAVKPVEITSLSHLLFLSHREMDADTASMLTAGKDGYVRVWSVHHHSKVFAKFFAGKTSKDCITCMKTDSKNIMLITGDSSGYTRTWYLEDYFNGGRQPQEREEVLGYFPYCTHRLSRLEPSYFTKDPYYQPPLLINSFRAHLSAVTCLDLVEERKFLITSSIDCSVRLWTLAGRYIGTFGQSQPWTVDMSVVAGLPYDMPVSLRRSASSLTLRVLSGGLSKIWRNVTNVVGFSVYLRILVRRRRAAKGGSLLPAEEIPPPQKKPPILGKYYTPHVRYFPLPALPTRFYKERSYAPYHSLVYQELEQIVIENPVEARARPVLKPKKTVTFQEKDKDMFVGQGGEKKPMRKPLLFYD